MTELERKLSSSKCKSLIPSLKCKSLNPIFTSLSTMKFATHNILSLMWRYVTTFTWLKQLSVYKFPASPVNWVTFILSALTLTTASTQHCSSLPCNPMYLLQFLSSKASSMHYWDSREGKKKGSSKGEVISLHYIPGTGTRNTKLILKIQVPGCSPSPPTGIITATGIQIVLCCTWTIHKGYYIVLHSFPFLQLSLVYVRAHFTFIFFSSTGVQKHF